MTQNSRPWNGTVIGDAGPYSDQNWQQLYRSVIGWGASRPNVGPMLGTGTVPNDGLKVQAQNPTTSSIDVLMGSALVQGIVYINTATVSLVIANNTSGNPRIDTIVLRADYALQTVRLTVVQGTPAASPTPPSLTQNANVMWDVPLADIAVPNLFGSISNANITPYHDWANAASGVYLDGVLNNSGGQLITGDVVIWDLTTSRAVTTTTSAGNKLLAGVWVGKTANGGYGRVLVDGIGYVNADSAVTRGDNLMNSSNAKQATSSVLLGLADIGVALETTSGAGLVLAYVKTRRPVRQGYQPFAMPIGYSTSNAYSTNAGLAANGGTLLIPITLTGPMLLQAVSVLNNDATLQRSWRWDLYVDLENNANVLPRVATCAASEVFTAAAASIRTLAALNAPVYLPSGSYYLAIQNVHASNTFNLGVTGAGGNFTITTQKTKVTTVPNGATLDIIAATWTASLNTPAVSLRGRAAGDTVAW